MKLLFGNELNKGKLRRETLKMDFKCITLKYIIRLKKIVNFSLVVATELASTINMSYKGVGPNCNCLNYDTFRALL